MMNFRQLSVLSTSCCILALTVGCPRQFTVTQDFELNENLGGFTLEAGVPAENRGVITIRGDIPTLRTAEMWIDLDNVNVSLTNGAPGKVAAQAQDGENVITVTIRIADAASRETVCEEREEYGPFEITLDENGNPTDITPATVTLSETTVDLINGGEFAVCIQATSTIGVELTIEALTFELG